MTKKEGAVYFGLLVFLIAVIYVVFNLSMGRTTFFGRATGEGALSVENSYVFVTPLSVKTDGQKGRVTVFVLDGQGKGMYGKKVQVGCKEPLICQQMKVVFNDVQPVTDKVGQAIVDFSGSVTGMAELQAKVEGIALKRTATVNFRE